MAAVAKTSMTRREGDQPRGRPVRTERPTPERRVKPSSQQLQDGCQSRQGDERPRVDTGGLGSRGHSGTTHDLGVELTLSEPALRRGGPRQQTDQTSEKCQQHRDERGVPRTFNADQNAGLCPKGGVTSVGSRLDTPRQPIHAGSWELTAIHQPIAFETTLWIRHLRLCPLGGHGTLCSFGGVLNPLWAPHLYRSATLVQNGCGGSHRC